MYACLAVTCHLHFWQSDQDLLHATAVTQRVEQIPTCQHRKLTLEKEILPPLLSGSNLKPFHQESVALPLSQPCSLTGLRAYVHLGPISSFVVMVLSTKMEQSFSWPAEKVISLLLLQGCYPPRWSSPFHGLLKKLYLLFFCNGVIHQDGAVLLMACSKGYISAFAARVLSTKMEQSFSWPAEKVKMDFTSTELALLCRQQQDYQVKHTSVVRNKMHHNLNHAMCHSLPKPIFAQQIHLCYKHTLFPRSALS